MKKASRFVGGILLLLCACTRITATPEPASPAPTAAYVWIEMPPSWTRTPRPQLTDTPAPTLVPSPVPTVTWVVFGPGDVRIPILLYHHIDTSAQDHRYYVSPEQFEQEIRGLKDWGYTTITVKSLAQAITTGTELPPHPILITFDDGHLDNYTNAFPIMQRYGFTGVLYIVGDYLGADGFMNRDQILEMSGAGWEVGSHGMKHLDVTKLFGEDLLTEVQGSKQKLENVLGIEILSFAYPFGANNQISVGCVQAAGYLAAMGAEGYTDSQGAWNLFDLQRVEIKGTENIQSLTRFLTWKGDPE